MGRHRAEPEETLHDDVAHADDDLDRDDPSDEDELADEAVQRSPEVEKFWSRVRIDPVEIALPRGVGYTLRAYRMSDTLPDPEPPESDADDVEDSAATDARPTSGSSRERATAKADRDDRDLEDDDIEDRDEEDRDDRDLEDDDDEDYDDGDELDDESEDEDQLDDEDIAPEEVPVFLTQGRRLLLFRTREGLVEFVRSGEKTDLAALDEWESLRTKITADMVVPAEEDRYELDLVVDNLRGGHDAWDTELLIKAGEICRDLGHALRIESVITALSPGSPLDDLDEALRGSEGGWFTAFFARRKLRRIGAQQAALAWRSIIGKISTSVDWRD